MRGQQPLIVRHRISIHRGADAMIAEAKIASVAAGLIGTSTVDDVGVMDEDVAGGQIRRRFGEALGVRRTDQATTGAEDARWRVGQDLQLMRTAQERDRAAGCILRVEPDGGHQGKGRAEELVGVVLVGGELIGGKGWLVDVLNGIGHWRLAEQRLH